MKKILVHTTLTQELEVPDSWDKLDVYDFLAENQSFRTAFQGVGTDEARIVDLHVVEEEAEMNEVVCDD